MRNCFIIIRHPHTSSSRSMIRMRTIDRLRVQRCHLHLPSFTLAVNIVSIFIIAITMHHHRRSWVVAVATIHYRHNHWFDYLITPKKLRLANSCSSHARLQLKIEFAPALSLTFFISSSSSLPSALLWSPTYRDHQHPSPLRSSSASSLTSITMRKIEHLRVRRFHAQLHHHHQTSSHIIITKHDQDEIDWSLTWL